MGEVIYHAADDAMWSRPFIDREEDTVRVLPGGDEVPFHYIHGGFEGTAVKFSYCIPLSENWAGYFLQLLSPFPGPDEEMASLQITGEDDFLGFALKNGAAFVESNMGSESAFSPGGDDTMRWKSSAAVAEYFRTACMERLGCSRPFGIVFGGSGGGYKTMACIENTDAWDGGVPFVIGSPVSLPNTITMHAQGQRELRGCFERITDALDAGGSGDMYEGLNEQQAFMLRELTRMGFPPRSWFPEAWGIVDDGSLPVLMPGVKMADPDYFRDFWEKPGYLGSEPDSGASRDRIVFSAPVVRVILPGEKSEKESEYDSRNGVDNAWQKSLTDASDILIELESLPEGDDLYLKGVAITFETGEAQGANLSLGQMHRSPDGEGGVISLGMVYGADDVRQIAEKIHPGDILHMDNSDYIAIQSYYRHQVPADLSFTAWNQFRDENGEPVLPQRANVMGYSFTGTGTVQDGNIQCPAFVVQSLMDESTVPWCADWYRQKVREKKGGEDTFRIYYNDRVFHDPGHIMDNEQITNYGGILRQALLDMAAFIMDGKEPLPSTVYSLHDGQILVPENAADRRGIQPTVCFTVSSERLGNTGDCIHVRPGEEITFFASVTVPAGAGSVTEIAFDFDQRRGLHEEQAGIFGAKAQMILVDRGPCAGAEGSVRRSYDVPGTYFASVRVMSQRNGDASDVFTQAKNLARVRVIVEA